jgi:hypothetical protein
VRQLSVSFLKQVSLNRERGHSRKIYGPWIAALQVLRRGPNSEAWALHGRSPPAITWLWKFINRINPCYDKTSLFLRLDSISLTHSKYHLKFYLFGTAATLESRINISRGIIFLVHRSESDYDGILYNQLGTVPIFIRPDSTINSLIYFDMHILMPYRFDWLTERCFSIQKSRNKLPIFTLNLLFLIITESFVHRPRLYFKA